MRNQAQQSNQILRSPNLAPDNTPVRSPRTISNPDDASLAAKQAARVQTRSQQEMVSNAEAGKSIGLSNYRRSDVQSNNVNTNRADPGVNQTTTGRTNLTEMIPGFSNQAVSDLQQKGASYYNDPTSLQSDAVQNQRNLRRDGCRNTQFTLLSRQNLSAAAGGADNRILKVEFFDLTKQPIPGTNPVEYQTVTTPSTFKKGTINISKPTLGGVASVTWDRIDDTYAIRYTYTPYSNPKNRNFFTYNHRVGVSYGGSIAPMDVVASYGTPNDGWTPAIYSQIPYGVTAVYLTADLYQTKVSYNDPGGNPCPSDPPSTCEVPSLNGGDTIRWCPGSPGANVALMYDDSANPSQDAYGRNMNMAMNANASRKDYSNDPSLRAGVTTLLNAPASDKAKELIGSCSRDSISHIELQRGSTYGVPDMQMCSETLVNPMPNGCDSIKRSFGLAYVGEQNYLIVRAFSKVKIPIIDPATGKQAKDSNGNPLYTYRKDLANVSGDILTNFSIMGAAVCPGNSYCSTEKLPDDPLGTSEGYYLEYTHTPMGGDPTQYAFNNVYAQAGASSNFTDYGTADKNWLPVGTVTADGTLHEVRLMASVYSIPVNQFAGCEKYMAYVADGFCQGGKLTCTDTAPTRTVGGVTFGPSLPNHGIVDLLKKWGTSSSAVLAPNYDNGDAADPTPNGPPIVMLDDPMCWAAKAEPFTSCSTMDVSASGMTLFTKNGTEQWATDCNLATDDNGQPLAASSSCKRVTAYDSCDSRFMGLFSGQCYNQTDAYDCGTPKQSNIPVIVDEYGDACTGAIRCLGTECHRPNLAGTGNADFAKAASAMEAANQMVADTVCLETGDAPTSVDQTCTPSVFGGKSMYCKIPIGSNIGITPNCCREAKKAAGGAPSWISYLQAMFVLNKIAKEKGVYTAIENSDIYNQISRSFGEVAQPVTDVYQSASSWVTDNITSPFRAGFDTLFGKGATNPLADQNIGGASKLPNVSGMINDFTQTLYGGVNDVLTQVGGQDLAGMVFQGSPGNLALTAGVQDLVMVFQVYSIASLIGHIIFACKQEEFEWAMNDRWRLCTFVDTCCSKKVIFIGCVEKRQLYCCYKSIAARVISEQIVKKNLTGTKPWGFRTKANGGRLGGCRTNCGGLSPTELAVVDWSQVDLTEWTDSLVESGLMNVADPTTNYGISQNKIQPTMVIGRTPDAQNQYDNTVPAVKSAEILSNNMNTVNDFNQTLRDPSVQNCYVDNNKMPFTYPGCKTQP